MVRVSSVQSYGHVSTWPTDCVYVGMPCDAARAYGITDRMAGPFGKPWECKNDSRGWIAAYLEYLCDRMLTDPTFTDAVKALSGKTLLCWCTAKEERRGTPVACHARLLAQFVNALNLD